MKATIKCCYKCEKREVGCHSWCEQYHIEKMEWQAIKEADDKKRHIKNEADAAKAAAIKRMSRGRIKGSAK